MTQSTPPSEDSHLPSFDPTVPNPARMWNYWLGGKDNFAADRQAAERVLEVMPSLPLIARAARLFLIDAVHQLATEHGIRQFLDIGTGLPTADNTHDVAQRAAPESKIVYVDYDPVVLTHAQALLTSSPDADDPYAVVARLMDAVPSGSYLVIAHAAADIAPEASAEMARRYNQMASATVTPRTRGQVARFFTGLDLLPPGLAPINQWALTGHIDATTGALVGYSAIARKP